MNGACMKFDDITATIRENENIHKHVLNGAKQCEKGFATESPRWVVLHCR